MKKSYAELLLSTTQSFRTFPAGKTVLDVVQNVRAYAHAADCAKDRTVLSRDFDKNPTVQLFDTIVDAVIADGRRQVNRRNWSTK